MQDEFWARIDKYAERRLYHETLEAYKGVRFEEFEERLPRWKFVTVTQERNLYLGMHGFPTRCLGNLMDAEPIRLAEMINAAPANYEFRAFYDLEKLPMITDVAEEYGRVSSTRLYRDVESAWQRWIDIGVMAGGIDASIVKRYGDTHAYK